MKLIIEHSKDNKSWVISVDDMLGKRPYNSIDFENPDNALKYITDEFRNCSDFDIIINSDLK